MKAESFYCRIEILYPFKKNSFIAKFYILVRELSLFLKSVTQSGNNTYL
jgi:hypothetical protein